MKKNKMRTLFRFKFGFILCCLLLLPALSASVQSNIFQSYIERSTLGRIDWDKGEIYGVGRGYLKLNGGSKTRSMRAAKIVASGNVLKLAAGMRLNDRLFLESLGTGDLSVDLKALIRPRSFSTIFVDDPGDPYYEVTLIVPLKGVEGLISRIVPLLKGEPEPDLKPPGSVSPADSPQLFGDEEEPWLVLDARNLQGDSTLQPALFPKIVDADGQKIYELNSVDPAAVSKRGMARYVVTQESQESIQSHSSITGDILRQISALLSVDEALAEKKSRRKRRRYIVKDVKESRGLNYTNLLISASDARELRKEDSASDILKNCRVIVVLASPSGGIEGSVLRYLADFSP